jgi:hypothetical protein
MTDIIDTPFARSYFIRHWRGDLSLPVSYWVNGTLLSIGLGLLVSAFTNLINISAHPELFSLGYIILWTLLTLVTPWQLVGTWRSAGLHVPRDHGRRLWAILAKISVAVGAIYSIYIFSSQTLPQISEYWNIFRGDGATGGYELRLLRNNSELEMSGRIRFGLTNEIEKILNANPQVKIIHLNSEGGRIAEARRLRDLIEARKLMTFTSIGCYSACILPYSAGTKRLISRNARLGFHQYRFPGLNPDAFKKEYKKDKDYLLAKDINADFLEKAFSTPSTELWKPSYEELRLAKMVDDYADIDEVALSGLKSSDIETIEQTAFNTPFYKVLKQYEPEVYQELINETKEAFQKGSSQAELRNKAQPLIQKTYAQRLPHASNIALHDFVTLLLDQMQALKSKDPAICYDFVFESKKTLNIYQYFPKDLIDREFVVMSKVIQSAATDRLTPPNQNQVQEQLAIVFKSVSKEFGNDVGLINQQITNNEDKIKMCNITYSLYKTVLTLPENQAGDLLRFMLTNANK